MPYLKQNDVKGNRKRGKNGKQSAKGQPAPPIADDLEPDARLGGIEVALDGLASAVRSYAHNAAVGENKLAVFTGEEGAGHYPILIALDPCGETTRDMLAVGERIATAFERIADALTGRADAASNRVQQDGEGGSKC